MGLGRLRTGYGLITWLLTSRPWDASMKIVLSLGPHDLGACIDLVSAGQENEALRFYMGGTTKAREAWPDHVKSFYWCKGHLRPIGLLLNKVSSLLAGFLPSQRRSLECTLAGVLKAFCIL